MGNGENEEDGGRDGEKDWRCYRASLCLSLPFVSLFLCSTLSLSLFISVPFCLSLFLCSTLCLSLPLILSLFWDGFLLRMGWLLAVELCRPGQCSRHGELPKDRGHFPRRLLIKEPSSYCLWSLMSFAATVEERSKTKKSEAESTDAAF